MDRGFLAEQRLEVRRRQLGRVERAKTLLQRQRPGERLLHGDLLVQRKSDQKRHRVGCDQRVGLVGVGEVKAVGHR
jgi:hypothetical protein